ncbi:hypothetical protein ACFY2Q_01985 [Micromonospora sp. NPDC000316]|uniref:hypothetical protein n=1 Tax=Micromonospora sp. NPDC000316 TaxID=3364216 RepID=UPI00368012FB
MSEGILNSWIAATSGLAGVLIGILGKYLADTKIGQRSRLFDEKLKSALRYLDAVEDYRERVTNDYSTRSQLKFVQEEEKRQEIRKDVDVTYGAMREAFKVARQAETALILLIPSIEDPVVSYLTAAVKYAWHEIEHEEVRAAQDAARDAIRHALGV